MSDARAIIGRGEWFEGVADAGLDKLAAAAQFKRWPAGSCIYSTGESTSSIYCVLGGRVRISITSALGHEFTLVDHDTETWLGEPCLIGDEPRMLTAQVKEDADVLSIPRHVVLEVAAVYPSLYQNLFRRSIHNARQLYQLMGGMLFYPLRVRLAGRLLNLLEENGQEVAGGTLLESRLSQNDFAHLAMGSRQRVNKIFREWNERGILAMQGDNYLITDIVALKLELEIDEE